MIIAVIDTVSLEGGGLQITKSLYEYVASGKAQEHEWVFVLSTQDFEFSPMVEVVRFPKAKGYISRAYYEMTHISRFLKERKVDIVLSMPNMRVLGCKLRQIVYLQQPLPFQKVKRFSFFKPQERRLAFRQYVQGYVIKHSIRRAEGVLTQTEWMKDAVHKEVEGVPVYCIGHPGRKWTYKVDQKRELNGEFFYPCGNLIYKNTDRLVRAFAKVHKDYQETHLYLTITEKEFLDLADNKEMDLDGVVFLGRIPFSEVLKYYQNTTLIFPSYIETLGLPLVEAKAFGSWIIASDCPFSREILSAYPNCDFFDPFDEEKLEICIRKVLLGEVHLIECPQYHNNKSNCWETMVKIIESLVS